MATDIYEKLCIEVDYHSKHNGVCRHVAQGQQVVVYMQTNWLSMEHARSVGLCQPCYTVIEEHDNRERLSRYPFGPGAQR